MKILSRTFLKGLVAILPISLTGYAVYWIVQAAENSVGQLIRWIMPGEQYVPGMGLIGGLALIFVFGLLLNAWLVAAIFGLFQDLLERIPLVKTVYRAVQDLIGFLAGSGAKELGQVVAVQVEGVDARVMGFVTRENMEGLPDPLTEDERVAVYVPLSLQMGGLTLFIPKSKLRPMDFTMDRALRNALTAWMKGSER